MLLLMYSIVLRSKAQKQYGHLPEKDRARVLEALHGLREDPFAGKKLRGDLLGCYAIRVWPYRIIYIIEKNIITVTVLAIGHRRDVYEKA